MRHGCLGAAPTGSVAARITKGNLFSGIRRDFPKQVRPSVELERRWRGSSIQGCRPM
jgi:hypothetical protein